MAIIVLTNAIARPAPIIICIVELLPGAIMAIIVELLSRVLQSRVLS
jgi:hypothetical protein